MRIAIDAMGGDNAPNAVLEGCCASLSLLEPDAKLLLFGDEPLLRQRLSEMRADMSHFEIYHTTETIECDESPTIAIRRKKDSSLVRAIRAVADGDAECFVSAGSSGAILAGATLIIRRQKGVLRPALAPVLPTKTGGCVLLIDCGANTDCKPRFLQQFALMGKAYMERVIGIKNPRIGLLNNGAEAEKGNELTKAAYPLLQETDICFKGNCEARDVLSGDFDVVVADGFDGNVALKSVEGTAIMMTTLLKESLMASTRGKLGAILAKPALRAFKKKMDYSEYGGAPLLGINGGAIKAHGSSDAKAIKFAILQAKKLICGDVVRVIGEAIDSIVIED